MTGKRIAFQGAPGAYSDLACRAVYPDYDTVPCMAFEDVFAAVRDGQAELAMIPIENSTAGRVADVHHLLPEAGLHIIAEHYQPIVHHLLALPGVRLEDITHAESHVQALAQCRKWLRDRNIQPVVRADTAGSAEDVAKRGDRHVAAIASDLAGKIYGLESLATDMADGPQNTTRFFIVSKEDKRATLGTPSMVTLVFEVRSIPAALYKALGGFASNGINITKLESYPMIDGSFREAAFRMDVEGHPDDTPLKLALEELAFFAQDVKILGVYPAHEFRRNAG
ncbi:MAG: prephenate dehydratase [Bdellovibrionales bacterium]